MVFYKTNSPNYVNHENAINNMTTYNRRTFIKGMTTVTAAIPFTNVMASSIARPLKVKKYSINFFTKPLDKYGQEFMMDTLKMAGAEGMDLTVRPAGSVLPENAKRDLPKVAAMAKRKGLDFEMMATNINNPSIPFAEEVLKQAAANGVKHYRLAYYQYDKQEGIQKSTDRIKKQMLELAELNKNLGIQGGYQNHTGTKFGSAMWDLWEILRDIPVREISSQFDIRHANCEASNSWIISMERLAKNIGSLALKDFTWEMQGNKAKVKSVPLGEGIIDFDLFFRSIKKFGIVAPITLHTEYPLLKRDEENLSLLKKQKIIASVLKKDIAFIKRNLSKYQLIP